jgi:hypothetical protein
MSHHEDDDPPKILDIRLATYVKHTHRLLGLPYDWIYSRNITEFSGLKYDEQTTDALFDILVHRGYVHRKHERPNNGLWLEVPSCADGTIVARVPEHGVLAVELRDDSKNDLLHEYAAEYSRVDAADRGIVVVQIDGALAPGLAALFYDYALQRDFPFAYSDDAQTYYSSLPLLADLRRCVGVGAERPPSGPYPRLKDMAIEGRVTHVPYDEFFVTPPCHYMTDNDHGCDAAGGCRELFEERYPHGRDGHGGGGGGGGGGGDDGDRNQKRQRHGTGDPFEESPSPSSGGRIRITQQRRRRRRFVIS